MQAIAAKLKLKNIKFQVTNQAYRKIMIGAVVGLIVLSIVLMSAYAASLQHANNVLQKENDYIQAEIDLINNEIMEETKLSNIEKTATEKLGMVYADDSNIVEIDDGQQTENENLASVIREEAYK